MEQPGASPVVINRGTQDHYRVSKCTQTFIPSSILFHYEEKLQVHCSFNGTGQEKPWREVMETLDHQWEPRLRQERCLRKKDPVLVGLEGKCTQCVSAWPSLWRNTTASWVGLLLLASIWKQMCMCKQQSVRNFSTNSSYWKASLNHPRLAVKPSATVAIHWSVEKILSHNCS